MVRQHQPIGLVLVGDRNIQLFENSNSGVDMSSVNVPVIAIANSASSIVEASRMFAVLRTFPDGVNVTIDSNTPNNWFLWRMSWWSVSLSLETHAIFSFDE